MGEVLSLASARDGPNVSSDVRHKQPATHGKFTVRLFLIVDQSTFELIDWLRESLEAHSYGDVVRQAVRAISIDLALHSTDALDEYYSASPIKIDGPGKRMNIRVPLRTKERLDMLKEMYDASFTSIISHGLDILAKRAKAEQELLDGHFGGSAIANRSELHRSRDS